MRKVRPRRQVEPVVLAQGAVVVTVADKNFSEENNKKGDTSGE